MTALALAALAPISLPDLDAVAALQTRVDRKYVLSAACCTGLLAGLTPDARVLEVDGMREFTYDSLYLDTPDLAAYHLAGRRRRRRFKVRRRTYVDSGQTWLEVKTRRARGVTVKHRTRNDNGLGLSALSGAEEPFVAASLEREGIAGIDPATLWPTLRTTFRRTTLLLPTDGARVTVDRDVVVADDGTILWWEGMVIVETKAGRAPTALDRRLWRAGHRPVSISKYGVGLAALRPGLPPEKWHRTLDHDIPRALAG